MRVVKFRNTRSRNMITLRKSKRKPTVYQLYVSTSVYKMLDTSFVEIDVIDKTCFTLKPTHKHAFKICPHGSGGGVISASSMVATMPQLAIYKTFEFKRRTVDGGYLFAAAGNKK